MSRLVLIAITCVCLVFGFLFMSVMAPAFPGTNRLLADETMAGASFHSLIHVASDWDGDGYGAFDLPPDDAPGLLGHAARHRKRRHCDGNEF